MTKTLIILYLATIFGLVGFGASNTYDAAVQTQNDYVRQIDRNSVELEGLSRRIGSVEELHLDSRISRLEERQQNNTYLLSAIFVAVVVQLFERIYGLTRKSNK